MIDSIMYKGRVSIGEEVALIKPDSRPGIVSSCPTVKHSPLPKSLQVFDLLPKVKVAEADQPETSESWMEAKCISKELLPCKGLHEE